MKRRSFFALFCITQFVLVLLHMNKHFLLIKYSFAKQRQEKIAQELASKKERLQQQICCAQNLDSIQQYAQTHLQMRPLRVHQIKQIKQTEQPEPSGVPA